MNDRFKSKLICPACKQPTRRTRSGECVHCHVPLEKFAYMKDGKMFSEFRMPEPEQAAEIIQKIESGATVVDVEGRMLTPEGSNPEIIIIRTKPRKLYKVTYRMDIPTNWVYCPDCQHPLFQNRILNSVHLEQEFHCERCHNDVIFIFITYPQMMAR